MFVLAWQLFFPRLANAEKDKSGHLYNRKSDFRVEHSLLQELEHSMTVSRKTESKWGFIWVVCSFFFFYSTVVCVNGLIIGSTEISSGGKYMLIQVWYFTMCTAYKEYFHNSLAKFRSINILGLLCY